MAENTGIEWTDSTFNPWVGCTKVSPGCDSCYASVSTPVRTMRIAWGAGQPRHRTSAANWRDPIKWNKAHAEFFAKHGRRQRVFCASLADVFDNEVPAAWRVDLLRLIESTPNLDWLLLTKRIGNVERLLDDAARLMPEVLVWPMPNVWLGATVVNQEEFDRDVPKLDACPAAVRFLSVEPMLGPIENTWGWLWGTGGRNGIDWVIVGGESGHHARPFAVEWARSLVAQCRAAGVAVHVKQLGAHVITNGISEPGRHWPRSTGEHDTGLGHFRKHLVDRKGGDWSEWPEDLRVREFPGAAPEGSIPGRPGANLPPGSGSPSIPGDAT